MMPDKILKVFNKSESAPSKKKFRPVKGFSTKRYCEDEHMVKTTVFFDLKERQKTVTCTLVVRGIPGPREMFIGKAICAPEDQFDLNTGMTIALQKAQEKVRQYVEHKAAVGKKRYDNVVLLIKDMTDSNHNKMIRNKKYKLRA